MFLRHVGDKFSVVKIPRSRLLDLTITSRGIYIYNEIKVLKEGRLQDGPTPKGGRQQHAPSGPLRI